LDSRQVVSLPKSGAANGGTIIEEDLSTRATTSEAFKMEEPHSDVEDSKFIKSDWYVNVVVTQASFPQNQRSQRPARIGVSCET
jgi:hypothetical protein